MEKYGVYKNDAYEETLSGYDAVQMVNFHKWPQSHHGRVCEVNGSAKGGFELP